MKDENLIYIYHPKNPPSLYAQHGYVAIFIQFPLSKINLLTTFVALSNICASLFLILPAIDHNLTHYFVG